MIRADMPLEAAAFLIKYGGQAEHPEACQSIVYIDRHEEVAGVVSFHHANPLSCMCDIAVSNGLPRRLITAGLWYAFGQLKLRRLTFFVAAGNLKSIALVEKLGAFREATLQDGCSTGEVYIYCLRPENCPFWSKLNGKIRLEARSSRSG